MVKRVLFLSYMQFKHTNTTYSILSIPNLTIISPVGYLPMNVRTLTINFYNSRLVKTHHHSQILNDYAFHTLVIKYATLRAIYNIWRNIFNDYLKLFSVTIVANPRTLSNFTYKN